MQLESMVQKYDQIIVIIDIAKVRPTIPIIDSGKGDQAIIRIDSVNV